MIRRKATLFLTIALLACAVTGTLAAPPAAAPGLQLPSGVEKRASVEGITEYGLQNGLRILLFPDLSKQQATVAITYLVGSRHEGILPGGRGHLRSGVRATGGSSGRVGGDSKDVYAAGGVLDDEERIQPAQGDRLQMQQVAGQDRVRLRPQELAP